MPTAYLDGFALTADMGALRETTGVEPTDGSGSGVASFAGGFAFDADFPAWTPTRCSYRPIC